MTQEVKDKLYTLFTEVFTKVNGVINAAEEYFGEENVDNNLDVLFDRWILALDKCTLGSFNIKDFDGENEFGKYHIDKDDYAKNGKGKNFTDYIPDLGIIDYLSLRLKNHLANNCWSPYIIVYFPEFEVTNERNKKTKIYDLYVKICITLNGLVRNDSFEVLRSTYTEGQLQAGYTFSHCPSGSIHVFKGCCLGSGPIATTFDRLRRRFDLDIWNLFFFELTKYFTRESLNGGPYIRMENIGTRGSKIRLDQLAIVVQDLKNIYQYNVGHNLAFFNDFLKWFYENYDWKIIYNGTYYEYGEPINNLWINMSNAYIKWCNNNSNVSLSSAKSVLLQYFIADNIVYRGNYNNSYNENETLLSFKDKAVKLKVIPEANSKRYYLIKGDTFITIALSILNKINKSINNE